MIYAGLVIYLVLGLGFAAGVIEAGKAAKKCPMSFLVFWFITLLWPVGIAFLLGYLVESKT